MTRNLRRVGEGSADRTGRGITLLLLGVATLLVLTIVVFVLFEVFDGDDIENFQANSQGLLPIGSQAPAFTAPTVEGGNISLAEGTPKATMLVFFATASERCHREAPNISELESQYDTLRVILAGTDSQDDPEKVREFVEDYEIKGPATYDPSLRPTYQVSDYPTTYVLDRNNTIVAAHAGAAPKEVYEGWIEKALNTSG